MRFKLLTKLGFIFLGLMISLQGFAKGRALVVISELDNRGVKELAPLYKKLEQMAWAVPSSLISIKSIYSKMILIRNQDATQQGVQEGLYQVLADPSIAEIDVVLGVHGLPGKLSFFDGVVKIEDWVLQFKNKINTGLGRGSLNKLGFLYNLSCYGESHIDSLLKLGFKVVVGSQKVNANAEVEYPWVLNLLSQGETVETAFEMPNSEEWLDLADGPVKWLGEKQNSFMKETDSYKIIGGNSNFTITN